MDADQKYCQMLKWKHMSILQIFSTFMKVQSVIKIIVLSIFEWPLKTGFIVVLFFFIELQ